MGTWDAVLSGAAFRRMMFARNRDLELQALRALHRLGSKQRVESPPVEEEATPPPSYEAATSVSKPSAAPKAADLHVRSQLLWSGVTRQEEEERQLQEALLLSKKSYEESQRVRGCVRAALIRPGEGEGGGGAGRGIATIAGGGPAEAKR